MTMGFLLMDDESSDDDDFDDDALIITQLLSRDQIPKMRGFIGVIHQFSDREFQKHFRLCRTVTYQLIEGYEKSEFSPSKNVGTEYIRTELTVLAFLW